MLDYTMYLMLGSLYWKNLMRQILRSSLKLLIVSL